MENEKNSENNQNKSQLQIYIEQRESEWLTRVSSMGDKLKNLKDVVDLQSSIITERQIAIDYYNKVLRMISVLNKDYRPLYAQKYNYYKSASQIRYTSDSAIESQIRSDLSDKLSDIELMNNHAKYMQETIRSIDDIIYGIQNRMQLEKLIKGYD